MALVLLGVATSAATTVRTASLAQLAGRAERIIVGRCAEVRVEPGGRGGMTTATVTIDVRETLKGPAEPRLTFTQLVLLGPRFAVGEEVVLFLARPGRSGLTAPVGLGQGKFAVERRAGAAPLAVPGMPGRARRQAGPLAPEALHESGPVELERLLDRVRSLVRDGGP